MAPTNKLAFSRSSQARRGRKGRTIGDERGDADNVGADDRLRREVIERDERVRREAREDAKGRERQMALQIEQLRQELGRNSAGFVPRWSLGGWLVRLAALVLVLRWRPLFKLIDRLGDT
eukprot:COSAG06_NODE_10311_length_1705_cov_1.638854_2_plen_120_part_00